MPSAKRVLIVYSHEREMAMYVRLQSRASSYLKSGEFCIADELYAVYLDLIRFAEPEHRQKSVDYLRPSTPGRRSISSSRSVRSRSISFWSTAKRSTRTSRWSLTSVNASRIAQTSLKANVTGVAVERDVRQTLDLLLAVQPDIQQIVIPIGSSATEKTWPRTRVSCSSRTEKRLRVEYCRTFPWKRCNAG